MLEYFQGMTGNGARAIFMFEESMELNVLRDGVRSLAEAALDWSSEQVNVLKEWLSSSEVSGPIASWTSQMIQRGAGSDTIEAGDATKCLNKNP